VDPEGQGHFRLDPPGSFHSKYHDPDVGDPMYGEPSSEEEQEYLAEVAAAQSTATQQAQLSVADVTRIIEQAQTSCQLRLPAI